MRCEKCNCELEQDAMFCPNCGARVNQPLQKTQRLMEICPNCGTPSTPGTYICPACGYQMRKSPGQADAAKKAAIILAGVLGCVALIVVVLVGVKLISNKDGGNADGELQAKAGAETFSERTEAPFTVTEAESAAAETEMTEVQTEAQTEAETEDPEKAIHRYEIIQADCTWEEAYQDCIARGGYLVRINTKEEWKLIKQQIKNEGKTNLQLYIGGHREPGSKAYYWVDENMEAVGKRLDSGYTKWCDSVWLDGEPTYEETTLGLTEDCMCTFLYKSTNKWVFNDVPNDLIGALSSNKGKIGYICEYEN